MDKTSLLVKNERDSKEVQLEGPAIPAPLHIRVYGSQSGCHRDPTSPSSSALDKSLPGSGHLELGLKAKSLKKSFKVEIKSFGLVQNSDQLILPVSFSRAYFEQETN